MTKLWIFSDLHLSHDKKVGRAGLAVPDADICVCAGDIYHGMLSSVSWLEGHVLPHMPVVFVPGNHEYYDRVLVHDRDEYRERYRSGDLAPGFHFLDCDEAVIKGVRFLGATAWTDFEL